MRRIFIVFCFLVALFLEISVFSRYGFLGVVPNVFLMFLISSFFLLPELWVFIMAFTGYLVIGLFLPITWGALALPVFFIFIVIYLLHKYVFTNINFIIIFLMSLIATVIYNVSVILFYLLWGQKIDFLFFIKTSLWISLIVNSFLAAFWYYFIKYFWENFLKRESYSRLLR